MKQVATINGREAPASATAIVSCSAVCPMCGLAGVQYRLNPRQFWNSGREVDLQPSGYQFRAGAQGVHPPLLAMWHCTGCRFTAEAADFQAPLKGVLVRLDSVAAWLKEAASTEVAYRVTLEKLCDGIQLASLGFYQAFKLHLLALRIWDFIGSKVKQDYLTQAKYCMLVAWLYRDMGTVDGAREQTAAQLDRLFGELRGVWPALPVTEEAALRQAIAYYEASLAIATFSKDPMSEVSALQRIGRIQIKLKEWGPAREHLRRSTIQAREAAAEIHQRLAFRGNTPGREEVTGTAREELVDRERRLLAFVDDEQRLSELIREKRA